MKCFPPSHSFSVKVAIVVICALFALSGCSDEETVLQAGISGTVTNAAGDPVSDVAIGLVYRFDGLDLPGDWEKGVIRGADKPRTQISFDLPDSGEVTVEIVDYAGQFVATLIDSTVAGGSYSVVWDATDADGDYVPSGMYYARITLADQETTVHDLFLYLFENGEILRAPHARTGADGKFSIPGILIPVGAEIIATDETGQVTGNAKVSSAILIKAVIEEGGLPEGVSTVVDWLPGERLANVGLVLN